MISVIFFIYGVVWLRYKQNLFYMHMILHIQVICFSYLLSIVLSPAVLDGPEWNAITCTQKQKKLYSVLYCRTILWALCNSVAWFYIAVNVYFETVICKALPLNAWSLDPYQYKLFNSRCPNPTSSTAWSIIQGLQKIFRGWDTPFL